MNFKLNNIVNICADTNSNINIHNISVGTNNDIINSLDSNEIDNFLKKMKAMKLVLVYMTHYQIICFKFFNY